MYTATWPTAVQNLSTEFLRNPCRVAIGSSGESLSANRDVEQRLIFLADESSRETRTLAQVQDLSEGSRVLIFCSTKKSCDLLCRSLGRHISCVAIHGDKSQGEREKALSHFRDGLSPVLVATDVAARGLDLKDLNMVVNFEFPSSTADYIHRIGRTGRAGTKGVAVTFFTAADAKHAPSLVKVLNDAGQKVPPEVAKIAAIMRGRKQ
mmetsp:Transcript_49852/g.82730  ORF Transcript_49852/g.82730 Transcript_49852/m.82730 type:complete len:208 (+) Transcript_49852:1-624(+)